MGGMFGGMGSSSETEGNTRPSGGSSQSSSGGGNRNDSMPSFNGSANQVPGNSSSILISLLVLAGGLVVAFVFKGRQM